MNATLLRTSPARSLGRMLRSLGCLPDDHEAFDRKFGAVSSMGPLIGAPRNLPSEAMEIAGHLAPYRDQKESSSCVGHAVCRVADARLRVQGKNPPYGSPLAAYTVGRILGRARPSEKLTDEGSYPRLVMQGIREYGVPSEATWPLDMKNVNTDVPPDVLQRASAWKIADYYRVYAEGDSRGDAVCAALAQKYPLLACASVDDVFMDHKGPSVLEPPNPKTIVGGHALAIVGYRTVDGQRQFLIANSWSDWGMTGSLAWVNEAWVRACSDVYAFTATVDPGPAGAAKGPPEVTEAATIAGDSIPPPPMPADEAFPELAQPGLSSFSEPEEPSGFQSVETKTRKERKK